MDNMLINYYYKFKLSENTEGIYELVSCLGIYEGINGISRIKLRSINNSSSSHQTYELTISDNNIVYLNFPKSRRGYGFFNNNNDLLLVSLFFKNQILRILVFKDMKPYKDIVYQMFINGLFRDELKALESRLIQ